jgi:hypothetical protein
MKIVFNQIRLIIFLIFGIVLFSCNSPEYTSSIDLTKNHTVSVFDVFSDVKVIKLETTEKNLINEIKRIKYYDSRYLILDERSQQIFCFDEDGSFVYKIDSQGRGQGEYHYITDFSIDEKNKQMVVLDPVVQRVHFFDLNGSFLSSHDIKSEKVLGLNRIYPLRDSLLLLISNTFERLHFYSLKDEKILYADFTYDVPSTLHAFSPTDHIYFFDDKVLFLVPLSREIVDVSAMVPDPYFTWCFGSNNNSEEQINRLLGEINVKMEIPEYILLPWQAVGKNKTLNHHIVKSFENNRFRIAAVEFDNDYKFVVIDKTNDQTLVFNSFKEGIRFPYEHIQSDKVITFYKPEFGPRLISFIEKEGLQDYFFGRNQMVYLTDILSEDCRIIVETHDPMMDNPFLVVYKFKE